jgi:hypothetical protein
MIKVSSMLVNWHPIFLAKVDFKGMAIQWKTCRDDSKKER